MTIKKHPTVPVVTHDEAKEIAQKLYDFLFTDMYYPVVPEGHIAVAFLQAVINDYAGGAVCDSASTAAAKTFLTAFINESDPRLDYLRACNRRGE